MRLRPMDFRSRKPARNDPKFFCHASTASRKTNDQTTRWAISSNADTPAICFQYSGTVPQTKKATAAAQPPAVECDDELLADKPATMPGAPGCVKSKAGQRGSIRTVTAARYPTCVVFVSAYHGLSAVCVRTSIRRNDYFAATGRRADCHARKRHLPFSFRKTARMLRSRATSWPLLAEVINTRAVMSAISGETSRKSRFW